MYQKAQDSLQFHADATSFGLSHFGEGSGEIFLDDVGCNGSESRLFDCSHPAVGDENCEHYEDAAVRCGKNLHFVLHTFLPVLCFPNLQEKKTTLN